MIAQVKKEKLMQVMLYYVLLFLQYPGIIKPSGVFERLVNLHYIW